MSRKIVTEADVNAGEASKKDAYSGKLLKYIPADVIAIFLTLDQIMKATKVDTHFVQYAEWVVFAILLVATPFYLFKTGISSPGHLIIATFSFALWVFSLGGPFTDCVIKQQYREFLAALALPLYTFLIPLTGP